MRQRLAEAIVAGDGATVEELLGENPGLLREPVPDEMAAERVGGLTPLHLAVESGDAAIVRCLLDAGADPRATNDQGRTALHDAVECGRDDLKDLLLGRGAELDVCLAAILGEEDLLREMVAADPAAADDRSTGLTPLGWAAFGNRVDSARILLEAGAAMDDGELLCAASVGHLEIGEFLVRRGADPDEVHPEAGGNALHAAASMKYTLDASSFVEMLLESGADPTVRDVRGRTALEIARDGEHRQQNEEVEWVRRFDRVLEVLESALPESEGASPAGD